jgi:hypothetical protein
MRLGLYDAAEEDGPDRSLASLVVALGAVAVSIRAAVGAAGPFPWDALLLSTTFGVGDDAQPTWRAIEAFARAGGPVLGIGAAFQSLCALGLLPGRVVARAGGVPGPEISYLRVEGRPTPFTSAIPAGRVLRSAPALARLEYQTAEPEALRARGQVIFRYCDAAGATPRPGADGFPFGDIEADNPPCHPRRLRRPLAASGAGRQGVRDPWRVPGLAIAGVCGEALNVVGLLAAPEIMGGDGAQLLRSLRMHVGRAR